MAVMAPRGLAAAVLASLPLQQGIAGGDLIQNSTYAVVLFSILFTSVLVFLQDKTFVGAIYRWMFKGFADDAPEKDVVCAISTQTPEAAKAGAE
jgi:NhaP-type Na+/H+ or K+/H+ antiporter